MNYFIVLTLTGLAAGMIYSALALSLVIIWRATRVVNFAQGALAMTTTYIARGLDDRRSEEHTSELQSHSDLVCRLLLEKKKKFEDKMIEANIDCRRHKCIEMIFRGTAKEISICSV